MVKFTGITILLSLSVFQLIVADMVPATSMATPLVGKYNKKVYSAQSSGRFSEERWTC